jgi:hypothetical protein
MASGVEVTSRYAKGYSSNSQDLWIGVSRDLLVTS